MSSTKKIKAPHHRGSFHRRSRALVAAAKANPSTRCARCGRTLAQHPYTKAGNPPRWSAGHVIDGQVDGELRPEVISCGSSAGAQIGNRSPKRKRSRAWRPQPAVITVEVTDITW